MTDNHGPMPEYEKPPVIETVLGVQFDRVAVLTNAHLGAFWNSLGSKDWPSVSDAPPLLPQFEEFAKEVRWSKGAQLRFTPSSSIRVQIRNSDENRMIQLQNNRLHFNWLGKGGDVYPRFQRMRLEFADVLNRFEQFVIALDAGPIRYKQWEVTYVNQIPKGTVWNSPADWPFFRPLGTIPSFPGIIQGESFNGEWHFVIPERKGRLHVEWQHGLEVDEDNDRECEFVRLTLTARGPLPREQISSEAVIAGLNLGHEAIVRSFSNLMSEDANRYWGLKNAGGL